MTRASEIPVDSDHWSEAFGMGADYRFVPLAEHIELAPVQLPPSKRKARQLPGERPTLSHQRPIPGGLSGRLTFELEATSPVLFGTSAKSPHGADMTVPAKLSDVEGADYVIPGRAARALVRSVFRIATFSALKPINDKHRFGNRSPEYLKLLKILSDKQGEGRKPERGWLTFECGDRNGGLSAFRWIIRKAGSSPDNRTDVTAEEIGNDLKFDFSPTRDDYRQKARAIGQAKKDGTVGGSTLAEQNAYLVISGRMATKKGEALFGYPAEEGGEDNSLGAPQGAIPVPPSAIADFLLINSDYSKSGGEFPVGGKRRLKDNLRIALVEYATTQADGSHLMTLLGIRGSDRQPLRKDKPPGIPVHYYPKEVFPERGIVFGLPELFKIPHTFYVGELAGRRPVWRDVADGSDLDWTEALFGKADATADDDGEIESAKEQPRDAKDINIGSRVSFAFGRLVEGGPIFNGDRRNHAFSVTQGAPKASYDPLYLSMKNAGSNTPATWDSNDAVLAGHKRYPACFDWAHRMLDGSGAHARTFGVVDTAAVQSPGNVGAWVQPLAIGAVFRCQIDFRNLHPLELGALLWSVSFGDRGVFSETGNTRYRHVGGRLRNKGMGRLRPCRARFVNLRQNPMPEELRLDRLGPESSLPDLLMAAFEMDMGARISDDPGRDAVTAFYGSDSITALLNVSNAEWDYAAAGHANLQTLYRYPEKMSRSRDRWEPDFAPYRELRRALYLRSGVYQRSGFKTVIGEFLKPPVASLPESRTPQRNPGTLTAWDAVFDPAVAVRSWRAANVPDRSTG